jgi:DNA-binding MarR family transcriptional regulator
MRRRAASTVPDGAPARDAAHGIVLTDLLSHLLRRAHFEAEATFATHYEGLDVTSRQLALIFAIARHPGAPQTVLADHIGLDVNTFSDLAKRSQAKGLIRRERSRTDGRAFGLYLTERGWQTIAAAAPLTTPYQDKIAENLTQAERSDLIRLLGRLLGVDKGTGSPQAPSQPER